MTPKEKAKELVDKFMAYSDCADEFFFAVECALIAVDEIINAVEGKYDQYWIEVKKEINNLKQCKNSNHL